MFQPVGDRGGCGVGTQCGLDEDAQARTRFNNGKQVMRSGFGNRSASQRVSPFDAGPLGDQSGPVTGRGARLEVSARPA